ncbi:hypothetical protein GCM10007301_23850 [Azorhizobium oxalatiphilum]|uniref:FAS1-like dehydratase domain-containing protein n=1 Tax=Azorhizobium oxalatiphilum TaxID=980631 RepID=A0A917BZM0_9HYPH|nr:MaoC family dehydratase N-terminal domain-containing protein [Azorhizobium oxalatiphilum]GGF63262.1 hypothetical protein GCM10007301_23850 [Azorhizobium oxalatiphilum]
MSTMDLNHFRTWIGRTETAHDLLTARAVREMRATLDLPPGEPVPGEAAVMTAHWCLAPATAPMHSLGPDGHPARGGFLPPVPLPRRMWAGSRLEWHDELKVNDQVGRTSRIADVVIKQGRTGTLCFVTVEHEITTARGLAIHEWQDIVYRGTDAPAGGTGNEEAQPEPQWQESVETSPVLLFRYSALTFNGHRIHYDRRYCVEEEGYPGLVVHGPLQATLLAEFAARLLKRKPKSFSFRSVRPIFDGPPMTLNAVPLPIERLEAMPPHIRQAEGGLTLWTADSEGRPCMMAEAV